MALRFLSNLPRFFERAREPAAPGEAQRAERVLASGRVFLAVCSLAAVYFDPAQPTHYAGLIHALLAGYAAYSLVILAAVHVLDTSPPAFPLILHGMDVLWVASITMFTEGPSSPFFVLFLFVLLAAAYRWGFRETVATAGAAIVFLFVEVLLMTSGASSLGRFLEGVFELNRLIMRVAYLLIMGFFLGRLAEEEKQSRAEASLMARIAGKAQVAHGLRGTLQGVFEEVLRRFHAPQIILVAQQERSEQAFVWEGRRVPGDSETRLLTWELEFDLRGAYLFALPAHSCHVLRRRHSGQERFDFLALDSEGRRLRNVSGVLPDVFLALHDFRSFLAISFSWGEEWSGRVFLFDPAAGGSAETRLRLLWNLLRQAGPAIYSVYLLHRLRFRAGAAERGRLAREIHDGVLQSIIAAEMHVDVLRRQAAGGSAGMAGELTRIQQLLHQEVLNLRELMEQIRPMDLGPKALLDFLADLVEKFRRETGITATFVSELEEVSMPPRSSRELGRIAQEALVNVRKHSGARNVVVGFTAQDGRWKLVVDDDGRGFGFAGRLSQAELDAARRGPLVIKERVRSLRGELTVESNPGRGARLEITLPQKAHG